MNEYVLGLGGNRGDRASYLRQAIRGIRKLARVSAISLVYESDALLPLNGPSDWAIPYYNLAVRIRTELEPTVLLRDLKKLEKQIGRQSAERWAPREIDIDILWMEGGEFHSPELTIPHPELLKRPFAALPCADLLPNAGGALRDAIEPWLARPAKEIPFRTHRADVTLCELIGILNITPDSFSDGGKFDTLESAQMQALALLKDGANILDLGGESTRPGATPISDGEEWRRVEPVLRALIPLVREKRARLSIDTRHSEVARRALELGVDWINDVSGLTDPQMIEVIRSSSCKLVAMHSLTIPADPKVTLPATQDPVDAVASWSSEKLATLERAGIALERVILDPGVGFGKTPEQSLRFLRGISELRARSGIDVSGASLMIGHSRKSFISAWRDSSAKDRDLETAVASAFLAREGVEYLRVHDVQASLRAILTGVQLS